MTNLDLSTLSYNDVQKLSEELDRKIEAKGQCLLQAAPEKSAQVIQEFMHAAEQTS